MLIARLGFTGAATLIGGITLDILWPLAGRYFSMKPEAMRLQPDGDTEDGARRPPTLGENLRLAVLVRDPRFMTLSAAFALGLFAQIGLVAHLVTRVAPLFGAAAAVSLATACSVAGRYLLSALMSGDRRVAAMGNFVIQACGAACLALGATTWVLLMGCVLFGLGVGNLVLLSPLIAQREFPPNDVPRIVALVTAVNLAVFSFAPVLFGWLREATGAYAAPFLLAAAVQLTAGVIVLSGRRPNRSHARCDG
jgi:hypothetical protein